MQYLATGEVNYSDDELPLNKLLCGLAFDEPVAVDFVLTKKEKIFSDGLISAMIKNWPDLKNTSITSVRDTYLQREGELYLRDDARLLRIKRQTWDILLSKLPWGIGIITLPWFKVMLHVEW